MGWFYQGMVGIFSFQAGEHELFPLFQLDRTARVDVELLHDQINLLVRVLEAHDIEGRLELSRIESAPGAREVRLPDFDEVVWAQVMDAEGVPLRLCAGRAALQRLCEFGVAQLPPGCGLGGAGQHPLQSGCAPVPVEAVEDLDQLFPELRGVCMLHARERHPGGETERAEPASTPPAFSDPSSLLPSPLHP